MTVTVTSLHPTVAGAQSDWRLMRHSYAGEEEIKKHGTLYLPMTDLQRADSGFPEHKTDAEILAIINRGSGTSRNAGVMRYERYKTRAVYHEIIRPAVEAALGIMHRRPVEIELPSQLEDLRDRATFNGEGLDTLLVKINEEQLIAGRLGLLADVPTGATADAMPYILKYITESIINWDTTLAGEDSDGLRTLQWVVLDESGVRRLPGSLEWKEEKRFKVLALAEAVQDVWATPQAKAGYMAGTTVNSETLGSEAFVVPSLGGTVLETIPFVTIGPRDLVPEPDRSPLLPLARIALHIYLTEADRRQALHMEGQDTLVIIGNQIKENPDDQTMVGSEAIIHLEAAQGVDAKYVGTDSGGLTELKDAVEGDLMRAAQMGAQILTEKGNAAESGDALRVRTAARTATLHTIAQAGGAGLEQILRAIAVWKGADPDKCKVHPNNDFADDPAVAQDLVQLMTAKMLGAKISHKSIHDWMRAREFTKLTWDEENKEIDDEEPTGLPAIGAGGARGVPGKKPGEDPNAPPAKKPPAKK